MRRMLGSVLISLLLVAWLAGCGRASTPEDGNDALGDAVAAPRQTAITVSGSGIENSDPFQLNGGDYMVEWTATPQTDTGCYHGATLQTTDESAFVFEMLANELLDSSARASGSTNVYGLDEGEYYIEANSGCDWEFVITQR